MNLDSSTFFFFLFLAIYPNMITLRIIKKYEYNQREQESIPNLYQSGKDPQSYVSDKMFCTISNEPGTLNHIDETPMFL